MAKTLILTKATVKTHNKKAKQRRKTNKTRKYALANRNPLGQYNPLMSGFPKSKVVTMRYADSGEITLNSTPGALSYQKYRANSIYDPDFTGGGHQPMGYDQWNQNYNHYVVLGAKITSTLTGVAAAADGAVVANISLMSGSTSIYTQMSEFIERGLGCTKVMCGFLGQAKVTLTANYSAKKFFNIKDVKDNLDRIGAAFGADAADPAFFYITLQGQPDVRLHVVTVIDYIVLMSEPSDLPQS